MRTPLIALFCCLLTAASAYAEAVATIEYADSDDVPEAVQDEAAPASTRQIKKKAARPPAPPSVVAYRKANADMMRDMSIVYTGDADVDFINGMIPHHQAAVDMANTQLKYGKSEELQKLARRIIFAQQQEIQFMKWWQNARGERPGLVPPGMHKDHAGMVSAVSAEAAAKPAVKEYAQAMHVMHQNMNIKFTGDADRDFVNGMIPHHQGAVDMARTLVRHGKNLELNKLAQGMILSQRQEIGIMQDWLTKNPPPATQAKPVKN